MGKLFYSAISSLDGYIADEQGDFSWAAPSEEVHEFVNDLERGIGTSFLGRRMYEVLSAWETIETRDQPPAIVDFAELWRGSDKIVVSRTLTEVSTARTTLQHDFDTQAVQALKAAAARDLSIGGPTLAAHALQADLVDELHLFLIPVVIGGGLAILPEGYRRRLTLLEERRFADGTVYLRYRPGA